MPSEQPIDVLWRQLDPLLVQHAPTIAKTLNPPASATQLRWLEQRGASPDVVATYRAHDGANYKRVARGGGLTGRLPVSDDARWTRATRFIDSTELVAETERLSGRISLGPGWVVIGRLFGPFRRTSAYNAELNKTLVVDASGQVHAVEDFPETRQDPNPPAPTTLPLSLRWSKYLEQLVIGLRDLLFTEEHDEGPGGGFLRIVQREPAPNSSTPPRRPSLSLIQLLIEHDVLEMKTTPTEELLARIDTALRKRSAKARAAAAFEAFTEAEEISRFTLDENQLGLVLERF